MLMKRVGRRKGFAIASLVAASAAGLLVVALYLQNFLLFIVAGAAFGVNMAFSQQYRYAASESVEPRYSARAISFVLLGAIAGAWLGPKLVHYGEFAVESVQYAGTLVILVVMFVIQSGLFLTLRPLRGEEVGAVPAPQRSLGEIARQPVFRVAVLAGATGYGTMTFIMTATPLSMHVHDGFSLDELGFVMFSHVAAMYAPSLVSGFLIERFGLVKLMSIGALALIGACLVGLQGHGYMHYWYALVLLGVGWNFLYVGATAMVTRTYDLAERFRAQAANEFSVFGTSALGSLLAGTIIHLFGWYVLVLVPMPLLVLTLAGLFSVRQDPLVARLRTA